MEMTILAATAAGAAVLSVPLAKAKRRIELSRAKHRSLAGHARLARRIASLIPFYEYDEHQFFRSDNPPENIASRRQAGFQRLASLYRERFPQTQRADGSRRGAAPPICNSPRPTGFRFSTAATSANSLAAGSMLELVRWRHRPRR